MIRGPLVTISIREDFPRIPICEYLDSRLSQFSNFTVMDSFPAGLQSLKPTVSLPLKINGCKMIFYFGITYTHVCYINVYVIHISY